MELHVESGWVHHINVVSHSHGGLDGRKDWEAVGKHVRQSQEGLIACRELLEYISSARRGHR